MLVATMATQGVAVDAIRERVRLAAAGGRLGILGLGLCADLLRLRRRFGQVEREVSALDVRTENERTLLREFAECQHGVAESLESCRAQLPQVQPPFFGTLFGRLFEDLIVSAEDIAETAALGGSAEFAHLVDEDLKGHNASFRHP